MSGDIIVGHLSFPRTSLDRDRMHCPVRGSDLNVYL